jgi:hypothetical protein
MRKHILEQKKIQSYVTTVPEAGNAFRLHNIDATARMNLANAAAMVSAPTDEVLAVMEYRLRRAARKAPAIQPKPAIQHIPVEMVLESELVA